MTAELVQRRLACKGSNFILFHGVTGPPRLGVTE